MDYSENITYSPTYRSLSEPVYRFRYYFLRLTDADLAIVTLSTVTLMIISDLVGMKNYQIPFLSLRFDPWAYLALGATLTLLISLGHKLRPEGDIELILRGFMSTKRLITYTKLGDRFWLSSLSKHNSNKPFTPISTKK